MAVDPLLSEVDADLRAERMALLWRQWRGPLAVFCATLLLATVVSQLWHHYRVRHGGEQLLALTQAQHLFETGKPADAALRFAGVAEHAHGETRDIALLWQGRAEAAAGNTDAAIATLKPVAERGPGLWNDLACLRLVALDPTAGQCLARGTTPLATQKAEWRAALLWSQGDRAGAVAGLKAMADSEATPAATRDEAKRWLAAIAATPERK